MRHRTIALTFVALFACAGCAGDAPQSPVSPSIPIPLFPPLPPLPTVPASVPSIASVVLDQVIGTEGPMLQCYWNGCEPRPGFGYGARFLVRETSGNSGATIKSVLMRNPGACPSPTCAQETGELCWRSSLRVTPGGWLDTFLTDDGAGWLSYCNVGLGSQSERASSIELEVSYVDDEGHAGTARTTISQFRPSEWPRRISE